MQRRLTGLGFDVEATGKFNEDIRSAIMRWQAVRGHPAAGYLNKLQQKALQSEIVSTRVASDESDEPARRRSSGGGGRRAHGGGGGMGGPDAFFGNMMGGMFGRR
ncbi:peptidoglycan-binding domain-containing protein [Bradyrhizobium sp. WSM471]|uniref:peptidoglycan-binding domain-containing protein n=1 Tax=Bradyrhizobium sp. WSM471 TaxID=319017 RepID=UPI0002E0B481